MAGGDRRDHDCNSLRMDLEAESNPVVEVITFLSAGLCQPHAPTLITEALRHITSLQLF